MLSNFQLGDRALLQSFVIGQPELRQVMRSAEMQQLRQRVIASYHLGPMDRAETQLYIEHRLKHVGWKGDPQFDPAAVDAIHASCMGIPRRINLLCNRALLAAYLGEKHVITAHDVTTVANEMRQELGPETVHSSLAAIAHGGKGPAAQLPVPVTQAHTMESELARLEERVTRLEKLLHSTVNLLHSLIARDQQNRTSRTG
jgi:hypothetical protein